MEENVPCPGCGYPMQMGCSPIFTEKIRDRAQWYEAEFLCDYCGWMGPMMKGDTREAAIAAARVAALRRAAPSDEVTVRWISVKERLPPDLPLGWYARAITYNGEHVRYMCYEHAIVRGKEVYRWKYPSGEIYNGPAITYWMPLPKPSAKMVRESKED